MSITKFIKKLFMEKEKPSTASHNQHVYIPKNRPFPQRQNNIPSVSDDAIKAATEINLPDIKTRMRPTDEWKIAFKWYNQFVNKNQHPLGMGCRPCWDKVYHALKTAKNNNT